MNIDNILETERCPQYRNSANCGSFICSQKYTPCASFAKNLYASTAADNMFGAEGANWDDTISKCCHAVEAHRQHKRNNGKCPYYGIWCWRITSISDWCTSTDHIQWSQYASSLRPYQQLHNPGTVFGLWFSKQIPRLRKPPPATPNALPAGDISNILQKPSSDSDVVIPNDWPRSSTLRGSAGKYPNHRSAPPPTSSSTSIPTTAGPFPAQRTISKNPKIAVIQLQITISLPHTGEVITGRTAKPLAVLRPRPPQGTRRGPAQPLQSPAALRGRNTSGRGSIYRKV